MVSAQAFSTQHSALSTLHSALSTPPSGLSTAVGDGTGARFTLDVVLLDLLVEVRPRRVDRLRGLRDVPAMLAQLGEDERLLCLVLELLQRVQAHRAGDDVGRSAEELRRE